MLTHIVCSVEHKKQTVKYRVHSIYSMFIAGDHTVTFSQVVLEVMRHLEGAYALIFKSRHYPNELIACKRGSPLLLGVKVGYLYSF